MNRGPTIRFMSVANSGATTNRASQKMDAVSLAHCRRLWAMIPFERLPMLYTVQSTSTTLI